MKPLHPILALLLALIASVSVTKATHVVGGELNYTYLGNNNYEIKLAVYFDCLNGNPGAIALDDEASIGIFDANGTYVDSLMITGIGLDTLLPTVATNCITPPTNVCVAVNQYIDTVNLPPQPGGYILSFQRCCRNGSIIQNVQNASQTGATYLAVIPDPAIVGNNSNPQFTNWPPVYICQDLQLRFDHSAFDADGDSLVYELCTPFEGASNNNPLPRPPNSPPYNPVQWLAPYSVADMMGGQPPLSIDPKTGQLTGVPTNLGNFVVGICVREYRNGILIGVGRRDFQFNVVDCNPIVVSSFFAPSIICDDTVSFSNNSQGALNYHWDFGVDTSQTDTTNSTNPIYVYPDTGKYFVTLIARDDSCADTTIIPVTVGPDLWVNAGPDKQVCAGDQIQLTASGNGTSYSWFPPNSLNNANSLTPLASPNVSVTYTITADNGFCTLTDKVDVIVEDSTLVAGFTVDTTSGCADLPVNFTTTTIGAPYYFWDFGDGDTDTTANTSHTYTQAGVFTASLIVIDSNTCNDIDTAIQFITVIDDTTYTLLDDSICVGDSTLIGLPSDPSITYIWTPAASLNDSSLADPTAKPNATTVYSLVITNGICTDTIAKVLDVGPEPVAVITPDDTTICLGDSIIISVPFDTTYIYRWKPPAGLDFTNINSPWAKPTQTTNYIAVVKNEYCVRDDTIQIVVSDLEDKAGPPQTICKGDAVQVGSADEGYIYTWTPATGLDDPAVANPTATPLVTTTYTLEVTDGFCTKYDSVMVTVLGGNSSTNPPDSVCAGDSVQIGTVPNAGVVYQWLPTDGLSDPAIANPSASPPTSTSYTMLISVGNCFDTLFHHVEVGPSIDFVMDTQALSCNGLGVYIGIEDTGNTNFNYLWTPNENLSDPTAPYTVATPAFDTDYQLNVANEFCQRDYDVTVLVERNDLEADFTIVPTFSCDKTVFSISNSSTANVSNLWVFGDGGTSNEVDPVYEFNDADELEVQLIVFDEVGCTDTLEAKQGNLGELIEPTMSNIFTPNADGDNDCLQFLTGELEDGCYEIAIRNRWGQQVYQSYDSNACWDGTDKNNGKEVSEGVYFYILNIRDIVFTGHVKVVR